MENCVKALKAVRFSYVIPVYNEEAVLSFLFKEMTEFLDGNEILRESTEVVLVDDGSKDASWAMMADLAARDSRFVAVRLSRNFGHQVALTAGYAVARGEAAISMDADLQDPLAVTLDFIEKWQGGADVVYGVRKERRGESFFKKFTAAMFYRLMSRIGESNAPRNSGDFRLLSRRALDALNRLPERNRYLRGLVGWIGLNTAIVEYDREPRAAGVTKYPLRKMIRFAADGIVSMSSVPLRFSYYSALFASLFFLGYLLYTLAKAVFFGVRMVPGWSSLIVTVVVFGSLNLICIGLVGEFVGRIYEEVKRRPLFLLQELIRDGKDQAQVVAKL